MKKLKALRLYCKTLLAILLLATTAQAEESLDDFYVVELIVFTHENSAHATEEVWPDDIKLTLPPEEQRAWLAELDIADVYPGLADKISAALAPAPATDKTSPPPGDTLPDLDVSKASTGTLDNKESTELTGRFFPRLGEQYSQHDDAAQRIRYSSGKHRLLLHRTWLQKFTDKENAPAIMIEAGNEQYGFHEVAGSIKLFKSRFLHLYTNLWHLQFQQSDKASDNSEPSAKLWPTVPEIAEPASPAPATAEEKKTTTNTTDLLWQDKSALPALQPNLANVALLKQQRRLRSREIHYIDHPLFGLIIEVRPFELPEPAVDEEAPAQ